MATIDVMGLIRSVMICPLSGHSQETDMRLIRQIAMAGIGLVAATHAARAGPVHLVCHVVSSADFLDKIVLLDIDEDRESLKLVYPRTGHKEEYKNNTTTGCCGLTHSFFIEFTSNGVNFRKKNTRDIDYPHAHDDEGSFDRNNGLLKFEGAIWKCQTG
jgi:hypothetical protein